MKPLTSTDKKRIVEQLNKAFGITNVPGLIIQFGKEKLRLYTGNFSKEELYHLDNEARIETIGLYFAKIENDGIRLTLDGVQLFKDQINKNILELDDKTADLWLKGNDLDLKLDQSYKIIKNNKEFLGCGKSTGEKVSNFVPKERRLK
jgi:NOL1/NOP2/fmu family ribosome biogenesis protein